MTYTVKFDPNSTSTQAAIIPDATEFNDGVMTKAQVKQLDAVSAQLGAQAAWRLFGSQSRSPSRNFVSIAPLLDGRALIVSGRPTGGSELCANLTAAAPAGSTVLTVNDVSLFNQHPADLPTAMGIRLAFSNGRAAENILVTAIDPVANTLTLANPLVGSYAVGEAVGYIRNQEGLASTEIYNGDEANPAIVDGPPIPPIGTGGVANVTAAYVLNATTIAVDDVTPFPQTGFPYPVKIWNQGPGTTFYAQTAAVTGVDPVGKTLTLAWALPTSAPSPVPGAGNTGVTVGTKIAVAARRPGCGAVTLADGRVLVFGGGTAGFGLGGVPYAFHASSFIYDPAANTWTRTGDMPTGWITWNGHGPQAAGGVLLDDGRVFVCGNPTSDKSNPAGTEPCSPTDVGYIFNPATGTWASTYDGIDPTKKMSTVRNYHSLVKLPDGRVLILGGSTSFYPNKTAASWLSSCEIFDPVAGTFSLAADMSTIPGISADECKRSWLNAQLLDSGKVMINGGFWRKSTDFVTTPGGANGLAQKPLVRLSSETAVYDPLQNSWAAKRASNIGNAQGRLFRLPSGKILRTWAQGDSGQDDARNEVYDPIQNVWSFGVAEVPNRGQRRIQTTNTAQAASGQPVVLVNDLTDWLSVADVSYMAAAQYITIIDPATGNQETVEILSVVTGTKTVTLVSNLAHTYPVGSTVIFSPKTDTPRVPLVHVNHRSRVAQLANEQILARGTGNNVKSWPQSTLASAVLPGNTVLGVIDASNFPTTNLEYQWVVIGTSGVTNEVHRIQAVDPVNKTITLADALVNTHAPGESIRFMTDNRYALVYTP